MDPKRRLDLVKEIASKLQLENTTSEINILLGFYGIKKDFALSVPSKKLYVIELLKEESDTMLIKIASNLNLDISDIENLIESEMQNTPIQKVMKKIFISHSIADKIIVEKVIDLLESMGVSSEIIFCSSFEGYGIELGSNFLEKIKNELNNEVLVLFILSSNFYNSPVCLCEMGATWVKTSEHIPILVPPFDYSDIKGVIPATQGMKITDKDKTNSLKAKVEAFLSINPINYSVWERKRDNIHKAINESLEKFKSDEKKESKNKSIHHLEINSGYENADTMIKENSIKEWPDDFEMQLHYIEKQRESVNKLKKGKPDDILEEEFIKIRNKAKSEWPTDFEMQLHTEQKQIESIRKLRSL